MPQGNTANSAYMDSIETGEVANTQRTFNLHMEPKTIEKKERGLV